VVAYLTARLEKTVLSEKMLEEDLSRVEERWRFDSLVLCCCG
jgi:hypothetical protein